MAEPAYSADFIKKWNDNALDNHGIAMDRLVFITRESLTIGVKNQWLVST